MSKSKIFVGSSVEGLNIAYAIQQNLTHSAEVTVWDQGVFELSQTTIESLINILNKCDFGIFVFSPDDVLKIRDESHSAVRDNVIFELGLFIGKLGRNRAFIVIPDKSTFHIPTDLLGVTPGKYDSARSDGSMQAATAPVCHQIKQSINILGPINIDADNTSDGSTTLKIEVESENTSKNAWIVDFVHKKYKDALKYLQEEQIDSDNTDDIYTNQLWQTYCKFHMNEGHEVTIINEFISNNENVRAYTDAVSFLMRQDYNSEAFELIKKGLLKYKDEESLLILKVDYLLQEDNSEEAIQILTDTFKKSPTSILKIFDIYKYDNQLDKALNIINEGYKSFPNSEEIMAKYAALALYDIEQEKISVFLYDKLIAKFSDNINYWGNLGNACLKLDLYDQAMISYRKAESIAKQKDIRAEWILANIGNLLLNKGFYAEGKIYFKQALEFSKGEDEFSTKRLVSLIELQNKEKENYNNIIKEGKKMIKDYNNLK